MSSCHWKAVKGFVYKGKKKYPPRTNNLIFLVKEINIELSEESFDFLEELNTFHISSRYPDNQLEFYNLCTKEFAEKKFKGTEETFQWLLEKLK